MNRITIEKPLMNNDDLTSKSRLTFTTDINVELLQDLFALNHNVGIEDVVEMMAENFKSIVRPALTNFMTHKQNKQVVVEKGTRLNRQVVTTSDGSLALKFTPDEEMVITICPNPECE